MPHSGTHCNVTVEEGTIGSAVLGGSKASPDDSGSKLSKLPHSICHCTPLSEAQNRYSHWNSRLARFLEWGEMPCAA